MKISDEELLRTAKSYYSECTNQLKTLPKNKKYFIKFENEKDFINYGLMALNLQGSSLPLIELWQKNWDKYKMHFNNDKYFRGSTLVRSNYNLITLTQLKYLLTREYTKNLIIKLKNKI